MLRLWNLHYDISHFESSHLVGDLGHSWRRRRTTEWVRHMVQIQQTWLISLCLLSMNSGYGASANSLDHELWLIRSTSIPNLLLILIFERLHLTSHKLASRLHIAYNLLRIPHFSLIRIVCQGHHVVLETAHATDHTLLLHPFGVHRATILLSFFSSFKNSFVDVIRLPARARMLWGEALTGATRNSLTLTNPRRAMLVTRMLTHALEILRANYINNKKACNKAFLKMVSLWNLKLEG